MEDKENFKAHGGQLVDLLISDEGKRKKLLEKTLELPRINLTDRQLCDLEQLIIGGFSPLKGFMTEEDYVSVISDMRLSDGTLWPMPITLEISDPELFSAGDEVVLCDRFGNPLAILSISSVYCPDKEKEARAVYGTTDKTHPGVRYIFDDAESIYIGGTIEALALPQRYDFVELRKTPKDLRALFRKKGWNKIIGFQTRNPIHRAHFELIQNAVKSNDAKVLIHPVVGLTKEGDIDYITRVRSYKQIVSNHMSTFGELSLLQLAMRMAGPREALWHVIVRKNYGCTHFIIGRDHAGPGNDSKGNPFYGQYDAQVLAKNHEEELGIILITSQEMLYSVGQEKYIPVNEVSPEDEIKRISGTKFRTMLAEGESIPDWFSFPEVIKELRQGFENGQRRGFTLFFTGLSSSGKSTIANIVYTKLLELQNRKITYLDGDVVRQNLSKELGFSKEDRDENIRRIGFVANEITKHGGIAICAAIAPYQVSREKNRALINKNGTYVEIYVRAPLSVCKARDTKGLYRKAEKGEIKNFTGVSDPYEEPSNPELIIDTENQTALESVEQLIHYLRKIDLIASI